MILRGFAFVSMTFALATPLNAQFADDLDDVIEVEAVARVNAALDDANFYAWVFGNQGNLVRQNGDKAIHNHHNDLLALEVESVDRVCRLNEVQKQKLQLAGRGDLKRFFDQVADKKRMFDRLKFDQQNINQIFQEIRPLQTRYQAGIFNDASLLRKSIKKSLNDEQVFNYEKALNESRSFAHRGKVEAFIMMSDESIGLTAVQRHKLIDLLINETRPLRQNSQSAYDQRFIGYQFARIPREKLRPLFNEAQWKLLIKQLDMYLQYERQLFAAKVLPPGLQPLDPKNWPQLMELPANVFMDEGKVKP